MISMTCFSSEGAPPAPACEVSLLVKRGWECRAEMSKFHKILLFIDWEYIFRILF